MLYPVLHLGPWGNDVSLYVRLLESVVIQALKEVGIEAMRREGYPGVWTGDSKICAVGASVRRSPSGEFVTAHGLALNVTTNLQHFQTIVPCGITDKGVTSVAQEVAENVDFDEWENRLMEAFAEVFKVAFSRA